MGQIESKGLSKRLRIVIIYRPSPPSLHAEAKGSHPIISDSTRSPAARARSLPTRCHPSIDPIQITHHSSSTNYSRKKDFAASEREADYDRTLPLPEHARPASTDQLLPLGHPPVSCPMRGRRSARLLGSLSRGFRFPEEQRFTYKWQCC